MHNLNRGETAATADAVARNHQDLATDIGHGTPVKYISPRNPFPTEIDGAPVETMSSLAPTLAESKVSGGNDVLLGGAGDDVLLGGLGVDVLDGGEGDDIEIQLAADPTTAARTDLSGDSASFEWLMAHTSDVEATIDVGAQHFTLLGVSTADLM
jgi:Ca2+-binding RTX toxin-like protein